MKNRRRRQSSMTVMQKWAEGSCQGRCRILISAKAGKALKFYF